MRELGRIEARQFMGPEEIIQGNVADPLHVDDGYLPEVYPAIRELLDITNSGKDGEYTFSTTRNAQQTIQTMPAVLRDSYYEFCVTGLRLGWGITEISECEEVLYEAILACTNKGTVAQDFARGTAFRLAKGTHIDHKVLELCDANIATIEDDLSTTPIAAYQTVKLLAGVQPLGAPPEVWQPRHTLAGALAVGESALPEQLYDKLEAGSFDDMITADVLSFVISGEAKTDTRYTKLVELVTFAQAYDPRPDTMVSDALLQTFSQWPRDCQQIVHMARNQLIDGLKKSNTWATSRRGVGRILAAQAFGKRAEQDFEQATRKYMLLLQRMQPYLLNGNILSPQHAVIASTEIRKKRKHGERSSPEIVARELGNLVVSPEIRREPYTLVRVGLEGTVDDAPDALRNLINEAKYGENSALGAVLERLRTLDFSNGMVPGLKKLSDQRVRIEGTASSLPLFEFKPLKAAGMVLRRREDKALRILFVRLSENKLGIVKILDRANLERFLRNANLRG